MNKNYCVVVSSRAEEFQIFFPDKQCHNLMNVNLESLTEDYVLYIERDYYHGFDFEYFLQYNVDKVNMGLIFDEQGAWSYGFDDDYFVSSEDGLLKEKFSFAGVALFEMNYFLKEFGLDFMLQPQNVARSIPVARLKAPAQSKALFLDRDGILIEDTAYPHKPEDLKINREIFPILDWAKDNAYKLVIVTNQAGIAKGKFNEDDYQSFTALMLEEFRREGYEFDGLYCSPFHPDGKGEYRSESFLRKPWPGMLIEAAEDHSINITESIMIGDKDSDNLRAPLRKSYILKGNYEVKSKNLYNSAQEILSDLRSLTIR